MEQEHPLTFGPFHLDGPQGRLWQGEQLIALRRQMPAVPLKLMNRPERLRATCSIMKCPSRNTAWQRVSSDWQRLM